MDQAVIQILKSKERLQLKQLYHQHRVPFITFGKRYSLQEDDLADIYQEVFLILIDQAITGKLDDVKSSFRTYMYGIGKFKILDTLAAKKKTVRLAQPLSIAEDEVQKIRAFTDLELTTEEVLLKKHFKNLGEKCREVLTMFYYRGLNNKEIAEQAGYEKDNVVKSQKSRCLQQLRAMIKGA